MKFKKLFATARKIELKLALAQEVQNQVIEAPAPTSTPETSTSELFLYEKPKDWSSAKVLEFQKNINAWGTSVGYHGKLMKEDGLWGPETKNIIYGLRRNEAFPASELTSVDKMFDFFKAKALLNKVPGAFGLKDKNMQPLSEDKVAKVQEWLKNMNRYSGPVDGKWNAQAQQALAKLQLDHDVAGNTAGDVLDTASQDAIGI